jgi:DnaJ-class molecular chaperone
MDTLKKAVKRLRRTWHPDLAKDSEDRRYRERKLKQINVAWDVICGKSAERRTTN